MPICGGIISQFGVSQPDKACNLITHSDGMCDGLRLATTIALVITDDH